MKDMKADAGPRPDEQSGYLQALENLQKLRSFEGEPARFWPLYVHQLVIAAGAASGLIAIREERPQPHWKPLALSPANLKAGGVSEAMLAGAEEHLQDCLREGAARWGEAGNQLAAVRLQTGAVQEVCLAVFLLEAGDPCPHKEILRRLSLACDIPAGYQLLRVAAESRTRVEQLASVLDLMVLLNAEKKLLPAAMRLCNEMCSRHRCERVSLGWLEGGYVRLQAISHTDQFDRKTEAVQLLEAAMEEALDQNAEIVWPQDDDGGTVRRDHRNFARGQDVAHLCSLPLRVDDQAVGVCTCERAARPFAETELRLLRLSCDQAARRLSDLKRNDRWLGARLAAEAREALGRLLGFEHTWLKLLALLAAAGLGFLFLGRVPYRVKAPVALRTDDVAYVTAPFDGHLEQVRFRVGDAVKQGEELLSLDRTSLLLREAELIAEQNRYLGEMEKARAYAATADMRITQAMYDQAFARHELVRYQLAQAAVRSPLSGVVIEGDLAERIGTPVQQGDLLFKLARIERLYAEVEVKEADVQELAEGMAGRISLASRPQESWPIRVLRVEPAAVAREKGNAFVVRCLLEGSPQAWWRPGMTGMARLEAGRRRPVWVLTHRTVDFLRLRLW